MKHSLTYYLTLFIIKLKGLKKDFSKAPIDYKKIRKEDIHNPKGKFFKQKQVTRFQVLDSTVTEVQQSKPSNKLLIFIHGGAFISGPSKIHWDTLKEISIKSSHAIWMCDYPKAPENQISRISKNMDAIFKAALDRYSAKDIALIGDSVGGTLAAALTQRLILRNSALPRRVILVSPVMDSSLTNPLIDELDKKDPMLSRAGVLSAKRMCAGDGDLKAPMISPLYGSFTDFPSTTLFIAENDITYPDQKLTVKEMKGANVEVEVVEGKGMPHIWPFLPVMSEAKTALKQIINLLNRDKES